MTNLPRVIFGLIFLAGCSSAPQVSIAQVPAAIPTTAPSTNPTTKPTTKPVAAVQHVVVISIDGLRPDLALRADMPHLRSLLARGSYSMWARTTEISVTLPSHVSMISGVKPDKHKILWNDARSGPDDLKVDTLLDRAHAAGMTTAVIASKEKFRIFNKPGVVDHVLVPGDDRDNDATTASTTVKFIREFKPNVTFVHFGQVDSTGHGIGWGTPEQIKTIELADSRLGEILGAIDDAGLRDSTVVIVSADHGGSGRHHGRDDLRSRHIPWICVGPGIAPGVDLTKYRELTINTEDTYATACWLMGLEPGEKIDGKAIKEVLADRGDLLEATPAK